MKSYIYVCVAPMDKLAPELIFFWGENLYSEHIKFDKLVFIGSKYSNLMGLNGVEGAYY